MFLPVLIALAKLRRYCVLSSLILLGFIILIAHSYKRTRIYQIEILRSTVNLFAIIDTEIGVLTVFLSTFSKNVVKNVRNVIHVLHSQNIHVNL